VLHPRLPRTHHHHRQRVIPLKERVIDQLYDPVAKLFRMMRT
jgi:hypothetical protein